MNVPGSPYRVSHRPAEKILYGVEWELDAALAERRIIPMPIMMAVASIVVWNSGSIGFMLGDFTVGGQPTSLRGVFHSSFFRWDEQYGEYGACPVNATVTPGADVSLFVRNLDGANSRTLAFALRGVSVF